MAGRKPKPTAVKKLEGNPGKRKLNTKEPIPAKGMPECPDWLLPEAKEPVFVLDPSDDRNRPVPGTDKNLKTFWPVYHHKRQGLGVGCKHTASVPKEEQFIVEGRHEGIITKEEFQKAQEIFYKIGETKKVIPKTYPLYRKVKCGTCGRAMSYRTYTRNGVTYRYFTCPHAKEQTEEDGCCKRYVTEDNLNENVWSVIRQLLDMTDVFKKKLDEQNNVSRQDNLLLAEKLARLQQEKEKCESDRFANVDQFMAGQLDKEVYQRRRADLGNQSVFS